MLKIFIIKQKHHTFKLSVLLKYVVSFVVPAIKNPLDYSKGLNVLNMS